MWALYKFINYFTYTFVKLTQGTYPIKLAKSFLKFDYDKLVRKNITLAQNWQNILVYLNTSLSMWQCSNKEN